MTVAVVFVINQTLRSSSANNSKRRWGLGGVLTLWVLRIARIADKNLFLTMMLKQVQHDRGFFDLVASTLYLASTKRFKEAW